MAAPISAPSNAVAWSAAAVGNGSVGVETGKAGRAVVERKASPCG
jgi:hypothetical protein